MLSHRTSCIILLLCLVLNAVAEDNTQAVVNTAQADCRTQTAVSGDSCSALASRCGISPADFTKFNPQPNLCATLSPGQRICCSAGSLPDVRPKPGADGTCAVHNVKSGEDCSSIANSNGLKIADINAFNDKLTWGWSGCSRLMAGMAICVSPGKPPMPAPVQNAICGPTKPGSKPPTGNQKLADLNPCPLKTCCNIWGQCGITPEYCTAETGSTGNPGTAPPGRNGCISNCGTSIANNKNPPNTFTKIGYYESWNWDRSCLNMRVTDTEDMDYTHIHWSFASIDPGWDVSINDTYKQWDKFTTLTKVKRVISFGGWGISTDPGSYNVLRNAMNPTNSGKFTDSIVNFVNKNRLDGVDIDWEYPGAPDIPGIPPGLPSDAPNYLQFLKLLRSKLPKGKSLSIAAPASFWYLKAFPIDEMAKQLDYIVYMTYDLHGQWDFGSKWSQEGCPGGNCLRSHVNLTETNFALAMITKAGVPANQINVGVSSYGRSFGMTNGGCNGPMCTMGGPGSTAIPGVCTNVRGYISNAEIYELLDSDKSAKTWYDQNSNSDILTYGGNQWVAFMSDNTKKSRTDYYKRLGFAGVVDWAIDLQAYGSNDGHYEDDIAYDPPVTHPLPACGSSFSSFEDLDKAAGGISYNCKGVYLSKVLSNLFQGTITDYDDLMKNGYDKKFKTYAKAVAGSAGSTVRDFINKNGNKYFTCQVGELTTCCDYCKDKPDQCRYCFKGDCYKTCNFQSGCKRSTGIVDKDYFNHTSDFFETHNFAILGDGPPTGKVLNVKMIKIDEPCPPDYSRRGFGPNDPYEQSVWWTLRSDQTDAFFADLLSSTGIAKDKITFQDYDRGNGCSPGTKKDDDCWYTGMDFNIPLPKGFNVGDVTNPKDTVQKALQRSENLRTSMQSAVTNLQFSTYQGDSFELTDSISLPVLMIAEAVENMKTIEDIADKIDAAKQKAIILAFISALLFFIPVAGEVLGSVAGMTTVATILGVLGVAGTAALDIYTIVDDPENAPLAIFDLVLTPLALADLAIIAKAANIRRGMKDDDVAKLSGKIASRMGTIRKLTGTCRKL